MQRAAEHDIISRADGLVNANSAATKPRMMPIKNLAKNGPVGVLKRCCTTVSERIGLRIMLHRSLARYTAPVSFVQALSWADFITTMVGFEVFWYTQPAFVASHGTLSGTIFLRVRHGRAFSLEKIAGVQARGGPSEISNAS